MCDKTAISDRDLFLAAINKIKPATPDKRFKGYHLADVWLAATIKRERPVAPKKMPRQKRHGSQPAPTPGDMAEDAFSLAMRNVEPLKSKGRQVPRHVARREISIPMEPTFDSMFTGGIEFAVAFSDEYLEGHVRDLDPATLNLLRAGRMSPQAHLDLHGLNASQAYESLNVFMRNAWLNSLKVVLIIPGRGRNSPFGRGILRDKLREWLIHEPLKRVVLAFCTATPQDGGPGSVYVLLRKFRKKGKINWDILPPGID